MKRCVAFLLCAVFCTAILAGCENNANRNTNSEQSSSSALLSSNSSGLDSQSFRNQFDSEKFAALTWLVLEETGGYHLAIPQFADDAPEASEINLLIKTRFYDEAKSVLEGSASLPEDSLYEVVPYVVINGSLVNLLILQTPTQDVQSDGNMFCAAYDTKNHRYLRVSDALEQDGQTELTIQSAAVKAYRKAYPEVLPEDLSSFSVEGVLNVDGQNEYICYLSEYPKGGMEYRYVIGYSPVSDEVYTLSRYTE